MWIGDEYWYKRPTGAIVRVRRTRSNQTSFASTIQHVFFGHKRPLTVRRQDFSEILPKVKGKGLEVQPVTIEKSSKILGIKLE